MSVLKFAMRISVGVALVAYLLYQHELEMWQVLDTMLRSPAGLLLAAVALYLLGQLLSAYRWTVLARMAGYKVAFGGLWPIYFSGMFFNMCLPTSIGGDALRVVGLSRQTGSKSAAFASVFMDRSVGLSALLLIGIVAAVFSQSTIEATLFKVRYVCPVWPLFLLLIVGYVLANVCLFHDRLCDIVLAIAKRVRFGFLGDKIKKLHTSVTVYRLPLQRYLWTFLLSLVYQASEICVVWLLAYGMGIPISPWVLFALVPFQAVASLLPITVYGVGVREGLFCAFIMGQLGLAYKDDALGLSLTFFGVMIVSSLAGGVVYAVSGFRQPTPAELQEAHSVGGGGQ
jgi:uncharacterized protein (TIRG00374 family)